MKINLVCALVVLGLLSGCAWSGKHVGASAYNDENVLTGGPTMGLTIKELPEAVKSTLKQKVPTAEISDIQRETMAGKTVYKFTFLDSSKNPPMWITDDGTEVKPAS